MYQHMNNWSWLFMTFGAVFWVATIGGVVYVAVRLAQQHGRRT